MMRRKRWFLVLISILVCSTLPGCWDRLEIEDRGTILGLAIDPVQESEMEGVVGPAARSDISGYRLTAQVAIPGRIPLGPGEGGTGGANRPVWVVSTTGKTLDDAMNGLQQELADKVFLGHLRCIIVNQEVAKSAGMHDIEDFFRRNAEIRRLAWLVISVGSANEAMEAAPKLERVPTLYLVGTMDHSVALGKLPNIFLGNYWSVLSSKGQEPVLPLIDVFGDKVELKGLAVFRNELMVGTLNSLETAAYMEIRGEHHAGYGVAIPFPGDPNHSVIYKGTNRKVVTKVHMENGNPAFDVYSMIEANVEEKTGREPLDPTIPALNSAISKQLAGGQTALIHKVQLINCDIFGFGEYVRGWEPDYWKNKVGDSRDKWDAQFAHTPIRVHVQLYIRRSGMSAH